MWQDLIDKKILIIGLIICYPGLKYVPGIVEVNLVNGVYDIVVKITSDALESLKETIT
jgi:hypothetical protein